MKRAVPMLTAALALGACGIPPSRETPRVENVWVRLPAFATSPGAAYFIIRGGRSADTLERISSPSASRIHLHGPGMRALSPQNVPAGGELVFAPAGSHAMVFWRNGPPRAMTRFPVTFHFRSGRNVSVGALAVPLGMPAPTFVDPSEREKECVSGVRREGDAIIATNCG